jgi:hypothetical protein
MQAPDRKPRPWRVHFLLRRRRASYARRERAVRLAQREARKVGLWVTVYNTATGEMLHVYPDGRVR